MKKVLLTGVAGFIASKTAELLLEQDVTIVGIDNLNDYYDIRLKLYRLDKLKKYPNFTYIKADIENMYELEKLFSEHTFDAVINLAARAGVRYSMTHPHVYMSTNVQGTLNILDLMRKYQIKKMVIASSSSLYAGQAMPFLEDLAVNTPISPYAATKKAAEMICYSYHYLYGIDVSVLRYFTVYGPAGRPDMSIFRFVKWIDEGAPILLNGDGTQSRDFTYVDDIAAGTIKALKPVGFEVFNLGGGKNPVSLNYVIKKIEEYLGKKANIEYKPFHKADVMETWADISKAKRMLDWEPNVGIDQGIKNAVEWHLANKSLVSGIACLDE